MAQDVNSPRYLPTYQGSNKPITGAHGNVGPNTAGLAIYGRSINGYLDGLDRFTNGLYNIARAYHAVREDRNTRDTNTLTEMLIRDRRLDTFANSDGKKADNLMASEGEWLSEARDYVLKNSGLDNEMAGDIFDKHAQNYLDRVGAHMLQQNAIAEENSKYAAVVNAQNALAESQVGDFSAYAEYSAFVNQTYGEISKDGIKAKSAGLDVLIDTWSAQNPSATLSWFNKNKGQLREVMGREFADVSRAMDRVRNRIDAQVSRAETAERRRVLMAAKSQKLVDDRVLEEQITSMLDDPNFDIRTADEAAKQAGASGEMRLKMLKTFKSFDDNTNAASREANDANYLLKMDRGDFTDQDKQMMQNDLAEGKLSMAGYNRVLSREKELAKVEEEGLGEHLKLANKAIQLAFADDSPFAMGQREGKSKAINAQQALLKHLNSLNTTQQKLEALDTNNPKSYASILINSGRASSNNPLDRMLEQSGQGASTYVPPPPISPTKPNMSVEEFMKQSGPK